MEFTKVSFSPVFTVILYCHLLLLTLYPLMLLKLECSALSCRFGRMFCINDHATILKTDSFTSFQSLFYVFFLLQLLRQ